MWTDAARSKITRRGRPPSAGRVEHDVWGIGDRQVRVLARFQQEPTRWFKASETGVLPSKYTQVLGALMNRGLIERQGEPYQYRYRLLVLVPDGAR